MEKIAKNFRSLLEKYTEKWEHVDGLLKEYRTGIGMGGSSMPLRILEDLGLITRHSTYWECLSNKPSKAVLVSYSGNTEEVLSYADKLEEFWAITSGGKLAESKNVLLLDKGYVPRIAIVEMIPLMMIAYGKKGLLEEWLDYPEPEIDLYWEKIKKGNIVVYGFEGLHFPAYYFKASFNENAKLHVSFGLLPEDNHNGLEALEDHTIVVLGTPKSKRNVKRVEFLKERFGAIHIVGTPLELAHISLLLSLRMAKHRKVKDPESTPRVADLKSYLKE